MTTATLQLVRDSQGVYFSPESCAHTYGYSGGNLVTDTAVDNTGFVRVKTFSYDGTGNLTGESIWVRQ
jgi:hypothetical protein